MREPIAVEGSRVILGAAEGRHEIPDRQIVGHAALRQKNVSIEVEKTVVFHNGVAGHKHGFYVSS
jgi:hypothetical protein